MDSARLDDTLVVSSKLVSVPPNPLLSRSAKRSSQTVIREAESLMNQSFAELVSILQEWSSTVGAGSRHFQNIATESEKWVSYSGDTLLDSDLSLTDAFRRSEGALTSHRKEIDEFLKDLKSEKSVMPSQQYMTVANLLCDVDDGLVDWINALVDIRQNIRISDESRVSRTNKMFDNSTDFMQDALSID